MLIIAVKRSSRPIFVPMFAILVATLIWYFGPPIRAFVERYLGWVTLAFIVLLVGGFVLLKFVV